MASAPPGISSSPPLGAQGAPAPGGADASSSVLQDIARDVGQQVEMMILKAKHASETKVSQEIQRIKTKMEAINEKIKLVRQKLSRLDGNSEPIRKADLQRSIEKLEEVWEGEVSTLKHELWQTIQAHNHNADLMKHHKEAIDQVQSRVNETSVVGPEMQQIQEQMLQVDRVMQREQAKQQQIDQFMHRLNNVQNQLTVGGFGAWGGGLPGLPTAAPPGQTALGGQMPAQQAAGKKAAAKKPKSKAAAKAPGGAGAAVAAGASSMAMNPSMRAEAPEFVPTVAPFDGSL
mmetsp:Transcript_135531/g.351254  ORF Transcript_135531/g.351254 Transcript_135531/m.351254 type:complete len:289 (+) Transcript_135531:202-1068(+)